MHRRTSRQSFVKSGLLRYIIEEGYQAGDRLPTIQEISKDMGVSVAKARESLEIARVLGMVEVKPGRGTHVLEYTFEPAATISALYAISQKGERFRDLRQMRNALEIYFWDEAVAQLTLDDILDLRHLLEDAMSKLGRSPIEVPAREHRAFHLTIFMHLDNTFVRGILESFWEAYEAFGLNRYQELDYYRKVWMYHSQIVDAIEVKDFGRGRQLLIEHMNLLESRDQL